MQVTEKTKTDFKYEFDKISELINTKKMTHKKIASISQMIFYFYEKSQNQNTSNLTSSDLTLSGLTSDTLVNRIAILGQLTPEKVYPIRKCYSHVMTFGCLKLYDHSIATEILNKKEYLLKKYLAQVFTHALKNQETITSHVERVLRLLDNTAQIQQMLKEILKYALENKNSFLIRTCRSKMPSSIPTNKDIKLWKKAIYKKWPHGHVKFHLDLIHTLIANGATLNIDIFNNGMTPLMWAIYRGKQDLVQTLIDAQADLNIQDHKGMTALMWAIRKGHLCIANILINTAEIGLDLRDHRNGMTALMWAICMGQRKLAQILITKADLNIQDHKGMTALMWTVEKELEDLTQALINAWANLNAQDTQGKTALMLAIKQKKFTIAGFFIDAKANVNLKDNEGNTALMYAIEDHQENLAQELIIAGANVNAQNKQGRTALMKAVSLNQRDMAQILISVRANIYVTDCEGNTALTHAAGQQSDSCLNLIIENLGINPLHYEKSIIENCSIPATYLPLQKSMRDICEDADFFSNIPVEIQDDNQRIAKETIIDFMLSRLEELDQDYFQDNYKNTFDVKQVKLMKSMLSHLIICFKYKKQALLKIENEKERALQTKKYNDDLQTVVLGLGVAFRHCTNRISETIEKFYWKYANKDQSCAQNYQNAKSLENRILKNLLEWREDIFQDVLNSIEGDEHFAATAKFLKEVLAQELGLRSSGLVELDHRYGAYAQDHLLLTVRAQFYARYNFPEILKHLSELLSSHTDRFYKDYKKWHKDYCQKHDQEFDEGTLWNEEMTKPSHNKIYLFAEQLGILKNEVTIAARILSSDS